jgi:cell filamentation protein
VAARRDRYLAEGAEAAFEPGSRGRVLQNMRGIHSKRAMAQAESEALLVATDRVIDQTDVDQRFTAANICGLHRLWLGGIYAWAGEYRRVNLMKDGFPFAAAGQVPSQMRLFERGPLKQYTPCRFVDADAQALAMGTVHAELILIHPFREGNGRCARLLAALMGLQAGLPMLDFSGIRGQAKRRYVAAIHAAVGRDYEPIAEVFRAVIDRTMRLQANALRG